MNTYPTVTIIMPVRNEARYIVRSVEAALGQEYPKDRLELIVVDGQSDDTTRDLVNSMARIDRRIQLIDNPRHVVPTAVNSALSRSGADVVVLASGHCELAPDYVRQCVRYLVEDGVAVVGGYVDTVGESWVARAIAAAMSSRFGVGNVAFRTLANRTVMTDTVAFGAYARTFIDLTGPFDEELVRDQDDEYNYRLRKLGGKILLAADVRSRYYSRGSMRALWRQYFQYGLYKVRVLQKHPGQMRPRQFVPALFVGTLTALALPAVAFGLPRALLVATLTMYVMASTSASVIVACRHDLRFLPMLPAIFATLHFSYGIGFLAGLVKFRQRWGDKGTKRKILGRD